MRVTLAVRGMHCANCVRTVTQALEAVPGVQHVAVFLDQHEAEVDVAAGVTAQDLAAAVTRAGYPAEPR